MCDFNILNCEAVKKGPMGNVKNSNNNNNNKKNYALFTYT